MGNPEKVSLKTFWETVEQRLAACSEEELRNTLRAMAQETPPSERRVFLNRLNPKEETVAAIEQAIRQEDLLADIDDVMQELESEMEDPHREYEWGTYDDEDSLGPYTSFVEPLTALFNRAEAVFDSSNAALARQAYEKLFAALELEDDYGRGIRPYDLPDIEMQEARARYLRAVYETEPPKRRPKALFEYFGKLQFWDFPSSPKLEDLLEISTRPLPDRDRFLEDWIAYLRGCDDRNADRWLREAICLTRGTQGLEELARAEGKKHPRAYLDWFTALEQENHYHEILEAAQEALQELPTNLPIRAAIADHLCKAAAELNESSIFQAGRWEAFLVKPTVVRLIGLWEAISEAIERLDRMREAARHIKDYLEHPPTRSAMWGFGSDDLERPAWIDKSALVHAYLLSNEWEAAHRLAVAEKPLGWSSSNNPQGLVVAFFLVALSGKLPDALPVNLGRLWREALGYSAGFGSPGWGELDETMGARAKETPLLNQLNAAYAELLLNAPLSEEQQKSYLTWCLEVIMKRVNGIVGGQHRRSYGKAAALASAGIEVLRLRGDDRAAQTLLDEVRGRFPRHRAFQGELNAAIKAI
jgi:hypothetical protein